MARLPTEVITHIQQYLSISDRRESALVCQKWYEASQDPILMKDVVYNCKAGTSSGMLSTLKGRTGMNLLIDCEEDVKLLASEKFAYLTSSLSSLCMRGVDMTPSVFVKVLSQCESLISLDISCCNGLFMTDQVLNKATDRSMLKEKMATVVELNISSIRHLTDSSFNRLMEVFPSLRSLSLAGSQILFFTEKFYSRQEVQSAALSFTNIMHYLRTKKSQIQSLDLSRTALNDEALQEIAEIPQLNLLQMNLSQCSSISSDGVVALCQNQTKLKHLDLHNCVDVDDRAVRAIQKYLADNLQHLKLAQCSRISDNSMMSLSELKKLNMLDLSACYHLTTRGLISGLCHNSWLELSDLNLGCCGMVNDQFILALCQSIPRLRSLDISSCFGVSDVGVGLISMNLTQLRHLSLAWCQKVGDDGLMGVLPEQELMPSSLDHDGQCRCLRKQTVSKILNLPKKVPAEEAAKPMTHTCDALSLIKESDLAPINNLTHLVSLDLKACIRVTDKSLLLAFKFKELRSLKLDMNQFVTDDGVTAVSKYNHSLEELSLNQCSKVTDRGVSAIVCYLPRITSLSLSNNDFITDQTLLVVARSCISLRKLNVSLCGHVSLSAVDRLEKSFRHFVIVEKRLVGTETLQV